MNNKILSPKILVYVVGLLLAAGCNSHDKNISIIDREPVIEPDYSGVTIPQNIAPLNFKINEDGKSFRLLASSSNGYKFSIKSADGIIRFPKKSWKKLLSAEKEGKISLNIISEDKQGLSKKYNPINLVVVSDPIDPYLCYRLLFPGYEAYLDIKIIQRCTENFWESSLVENQVLNTNCVNCHTFRQNDPDKFLLHVRGSEGGTYFSEGDKIVRRDLKTPEMKYGAVYPAWHPNGEIVAFSSNSIVQSFHASQEYNIEVTDLASSLVVYNIIKNEMSTVEEEDSAKYMETFPEWSPDGRYLYYCRARQTNDTSDFPRIKYNLVRKAFDQDAFSFGKAEVIFNADSIDKSISFPRISPDGKYLVFTLHNNGNFSIWHKEADLYLLDLMTQKTERMNVNSSETESYHSWSSNSKWIVFSSKRDDGLTARPYFAYFDPPDHFGKPFILPQKDPTLYTRMEKTFNRPEFVTGRIKYGPRDFERASNKAAEKAKWSGN
ncbi:MAG TPA: hypothetical protein VMV47_13175 [Bacteroidales bacterium]|nr:hypothetical protein [Bacteroidales bacterium]